MCKLEAARPPEMAFLREAASVASFAVAGCLLRIYLGVGFGPSSSGGAGVTSPSSAFFSDLPANALGCAVMGLLAPGASADRLHLLGAEEDRPAAGQPALAFARGSPLSSPLLLLGARTGFCGTLTTFASWSQQCVAMLAAGDVLGGLTGYTLGMQASRLPRLSVLLRG